MTGLLPSAQRRTSSIPAGVSLPDVPLQDELGNDLVDENSVVIAAELGAVVSEQPRRSSPLAAGTKRITTI